MTLLSACTLAEEIAETSGPEAQFSLGKSYEEGTLQPPDYERAAYWYRKAAEQGHQKAQLRLGDLYETGLGVKRDLLQARNWYTKAAKRSKDRDIQLCLKVERKLTSVEQIYRMKQEVGVRPRVIIY